ncbi:uncharacterized protein LOC124255934 [Haliotis rubra]|uniref:uncharacterized protein LOC124255934 n=1 Tax=Haliotis rubra TaxID=36100 RepID=UPI001EE5E27A|nr:uncharacterized protein LOC124255934 [Haliotis rubra]
MSTVLELQFVATEHAIGNYMKGWRMNVDQNIDIDDVKPMIAGKVNEELTDLGSLKFQITVKMWLDKQQADGSRVYVKPYFRGRENHQEKAAYRRSHAYDPSRPIRPSHYSKLSAGERCPSFIETISLSKMTCQNRSISLTTWEHFTLHGPMMMFMLLILVVGILGNILVLYIYTRKITIVVFGFFVKILAVFDLASTVVSVPATLISGLISPDDIDAGHMCKVMTFVKHFSTLNSGIMFIIIAFQRYRKVCQPRKTQMSEMLAKKLCLTSLFVSAAASTPIIFVIRAYDLAVNLMFLNCAINPFVYSFTSSVFRKEFKRVLCFFKSGEQTSAAQGSQLQRQLTVPAR